MSRPRGLSMHDDAADALPRRAGGPESAMTRVRPPGWSYNPSAWSERGPLLALAAIGLGIATYTTLYQWGVIGTFWDPFFGSASSAAALHSKISTILPIPDGTLGIPGYLCDLIFDVLGGADRWRRMPWVVLAFGATITGLATVSTLLTISQGILVQRWCTLCTGSAVISLLILAVGIGEVLATLQYLQRTYARRQMPLAVWHALWGRSFDARTDL